MPHIHEKIDFTAEVYIVFENKVLLRKHDKFKIWLSVGGHVELDEDPTEAAVREAKEEVGLDITLWQPPSYTAMQDDNYKELIPPAFMNRHSIDETHEHISLIYYATSETDKLILSETEVSDGCKWCTAQELEQIDLLPQIKQYAKAALETIKS